MKNSIRDYFTFTNSERNGVIILLCLILIVPLIISVSIPKKSDTVYNDSLMRVETEAFLREIQNGRQYLAVVTTGKENNDNSKFISRFKPFHFNPNTATLQDYCKMGFTERQSATIINYREKGGKFYKKEDFNKLYVVDEEAYKIFEPFIILPPDENKNSDKNPHKSPVADYPTSKGLSSQSVNVEINSADSLELLTIRGIGPVFASRIIKYRNKLGGFASRQQLMDVYGLDSTRYPEISKQINVDTSLIRKIDINNIPLDQLQKHPYVGYRLAKAITDKRIQSGGFKSFNDLEKSLVSNKPRILKLKPYILIR